MTRAELSDFKRRVEMPACITSFVFPLPVTAEEQEVYAAYRVERNETHRIWRESEARSNV